MSKLKTLVSKLTTDEKVFVLAGFSMALSVPFLGSIGFQLWLGVKIVYILGIVLIFMRKS